MIEAMACGTPTIAFRCGSVPELITHGTSGLIVDNMKDAAAAVERVLCMDRAVCRNAFEARFTASRMAKDYIKLYETILSARSLSENTPEMDAYLTL
jgi:glycosyltransferase involved in cell wall biosynthesis